jgi:regulator of sigma E protease
LGQKQSNAAFGRSINVSFTITIIAFILIFGPLILLHELGHFLTALALGVKVEEFGVGYPPRIYGIKRGGIIYSINYIPFGGFTRMAGEEDPDIPGSLASKPAWVRIIVLSAGALMFAIVPLFLFPAGLMVPHDVAIGGSVIRAVVADSPAAVAGIQPGDMIVSINGNAVYNLSDTQRYIQQNLDKPTEIELTKADKSTYVVTVTPRLNPPAGQGALGITLGPKIVTESLSVWEAIPRAFSKYGQAIILLFKGLGDMITGATPVVIAGPVAIAQLTGEVAQAGLSSLLDFAAVLSLDLAITNLLPFPALDGGRILFVFIELVRGKRISPKTEGMIHTIGFILLLTLMAFVTLTDVLRIINGGSLLP